MRLLATLALGICLSCQGVLAQDSAAHARKIEHIRKMMALTGGEKMADQMFDQMAQSLPASGPGADAFLEEFRNKFDVKRFVEIVVAAYDKHMSDEDVLAIVQFYESPSGKRWIEATPKIMDEMMSGAMVISREMTEKLRKKAGSGK